MARAPDAIRKAWRQMEEVIHARYKLFFAGKEGCKQIDVAEILRQVLLLNETRAKEAQARVTGPSQEAVRINTYGDDLKIALLELVRNAFEALKESHRPPDERTLEVTITTEGGDILVAISDNGDGFSNEAMAHLFEPGFSTRKEDRRHQGLGLYFAERMIKAIGGTIMVSNGNNGGAQVHVTLRNLPVPTP